MSTDAPVETGSPAPAAVSTPAAPSLPASDNLKDLSAAWASAPAAKPDTPVVEEAVSRETGAEPEAEVKSGEGAGEGGEGEVKTGEAPKRDAEGKFVKLITVEHNGTKYELPPDLPVPFKVNGEVQTRTLEEALKANSASGAVSQAKEEARLAVRGAKAEIAAAQAETAAVRAVLADIRKNPSQADRIINDPEYAALFDEAMEAKVSKAAKSARETASTAGLDREYAQQAVGWIQQVAQDFPNVDPNEVRIAFSQYLGTEEASQDRLAFTPERVRTFFEKAQGKVAKVLTPLQQQLEAQAKEIAELKAAIKANGKTDKVLERQKAPPVGPGGSGVTQGAATVTGDGKTLRDASAAWASSK